MAIENLTYLPFVGLAVLFWYMGSRILGNRGDLSTSESQELLLDHLRNIKLNTRLADTEVERELNLLKGTRIEKVFYVNVNYSYYEFEAFDSVDSGIMIQIEGGRFLNWLFTTGAYDSENAIIHPGFYVDFSDVLSSMNTASPIINVSRDKKWKVFVNSKIDNIQLKRVDFEGCKICEQLIIETESKDRVGIFSTTEPEILGDKTFLAKLDFAVDWTTVVFDEELLSKH